MMSRDELEAAMNKFSDLMAKKDEVEYGSDEQEEIDTELFVEAAKIVRHAVMCLHDIREELLRQNSHMGR